MAVFFSIEGVVVAVEFEEKLLDAWQKEEDEREQKLKEVITRFLLTISLSKVVAIF